MANLLDRTETLALSAHEIHDLTGWPAEMIEDYLNLVRNILLTAATVDAESLVLDQVEVDVAVNAAGITENSAAIASLQPLSGAGDPSGVVTSNDSLVYYRAYVSGDVNVRELWRSSVSGTTGNWVLFSSYSEKV